MATLYVELKKKFKLVTLKEIFFNCQPFINKFPVQARKSSQSI